jgi:uncharacterized protein YueI
MFDSVQELLNNRKSAQSQSKSAEVNPLAGLMFCKDCGEKMYHYRNARHTNGGYFVCSTNKYTRVGVANMKCSPHHIKEADISELVLDSINRICFYACEKPSDFIDKCYENTKYYQATRVFLLKEQISQNKKRTNEIKRIFRCLYEERVLGKIADSRYDSVLDQYRTEQSELETMSEKLQTELDTYTVDYKDIGAFSKLAQKYESATKLTPTLVGEFISKIVVYESQRSTHKIEIYFNLIGNFKIPDISAIT